jgi:hypothetical protein
MAPVRDSVSSGSAISTGSSLSSATIEEAALPDRAARGAGLASACSALLAAERR